jgi:hypothetical protein
VAAQQDAPKGSSSGAVEGRELDSRRLHCWRRRSRYSQSFATEATHYWLARLCFSRTATLPRIYPSFSTCTVLLCSCPRCTSSEACNTAPGLYWRIPAPDLLDGTHPWRPLLKRRNKLHPSPVQPTSATANHCDRPVRLCHRLGVRPSGAPLRELQRS